MTHWALQRIRAESDDRNLIEWVEKATELQERIDAALNVLDNSYDKDGDVTYVTPRDPRIVLAETRAVLGGK